MSIMSAELPRSSNGSFLSSKKLVSLAVILLLCLGFGFKISHAAVAPVDPNDDSSNIISGHRRPISVKSEEHAGDAADSSGPKQEHNVKTGSFRDKDDDVVKIHKTVEEELDEEIKARSSFGKQGEFVHGFIATLSVIIVSELGDKTFFIAAIMAMKHSRMTVFAGSISALAVMHVMSSFFGYAITVIPRVYTFYLSSFLFAVFGIKMLKEGWKMSPNEAQEEYDEVQEDLRKRETDDIESGGSTSGPRRVTLWGLISKIFLQSFTMTFLAEWGDRSQLATIVLAAREEIRSVIIGGILGHALCTGLAVMGGRFIAQRISVRTVTLIGGVVFILFAMTAFFMDPSET